LKRVYIVGIAVVAVVWLAIGLIIAQGPQPEIVVPAEKLFGAGPLNVTNTLLTSWIVMALLIILSLFATRSMKLIPGGLQNFVEASIGFLVSQIEEIAGEKNGRRFFMVVATIFLYIIFNNWFGLMPFFNAIGKTEDINEKVVETITTQQDKGEPFADAVKIAAWKMDNSGGITLVKPRAKAVDFNIEAGWSAARATDEYVLFLAEKYTSYRRPADNAGAAPSKDDAVAARAALDADPKAPKLTVEADALAGEGIDSESIGHISNITFPGKKLGLIIPYFRGAFSDLNNTLALGIIAFVAIEFWGFQSLGAGYLKKFFNLNGINSFVGVLELLSEFIRIISFTFRLFGNIFAGEVLILMLTFLMPFLFVDIIYGLELFVGFIQATVFALLTLVFATMAVEHHGEDEHHEEHQGEEASADAHHHSGAAQAH
jgi:F-type H+-transporting ATPase subunit a